MTTAEVFADYLGLTPENAPWAWTRSACSRCNGWGSRYTGLIPHRCEACKGNGNEFTLTATSPLAHEPTPGWLEALIRRGFDLTNYGSHFEGSARECGVLYEVNATHPTHAVARALIAADPTLREACERAVDYEKETNNEN